jgi:hypothetical protein
MSQAFHKQIDTEKENAVRKISIVQHLAQKLYLRTNYNVLKEKKQQILSLIENIPERTAKKM